MQRIRVVAAVGVGLTALLMAGCVGPEKSVESPTIPSPTSSSKPKPATANVPFGSGAVPPYANGMLSPTVSNQTTRNSTISTFANTWINEFVVQDPACVALNPNWWQVTKKGEGDQYPYVAEGQGYGMMLLAYMAGAVPNAQEKFDGIAKFVLDHPSNIDPALMGSELKPNCKPASGFDSATDGDIDIAYAFLLADKQWGGSGGLSRSYKDLAVDRMHGILASEINPSTHLTLLGDWAKSVTSDKHYWTRTSDWVVDHFRAFAASDPDHQAAWNQVITATQNLINTAQQWPNPGTSAHLLPDFIVNTNTTPEPAPPGFESEYDGDYSYNACRDPWRIGSDAILYGDETSLAQSRLLNGFSETVAAGGKKKKKATLVPTRIKANYTLTGVPQEQWDGAMFISPFGVTSITNSASQAWVNAEWNYMKNEIGSKAHHRSMGYFDGFITIMSMLGANHNLWAPDHIAK